MGHYSLLVLLAYFNLTGAQLSIGFIFPSIEGYTQDEMDHLFNSIVKP